MNKVAKVTGNYIPFALKEGEIINIIRTVR